MRPVILVILLGVICDVHGQEFDSKYLKSIVRTLSSDSMDGRFPGTEGIERAANYIERSFREAGVADVRRESFDLVERGWEQVYLRSGDRKFFNADDFVIHGPEPIQTEIERELVFAGRATADELKSVEVKDRVVLVFVTNLRSWFDLAQTLGRRGAVALMVANPGNPDQFAFVRDGLKDYVTARRLFLGSPDSVRSLPLLDTIRFVRTFIIKNELVPVLMKASIKHLLKAADNKTLKSVATATIGLKVERRTRTVATANIVARVQGQTDSAIVVSAHYDHMGHSDDKIFHGADDNASGTAGIIALAKKYSQLSLKYSVVFLATTAEEEGLLGSRYHTTSKDFDEKKIVFNLNLDMIGATDPKHRSRNAYVYVVGPSHPVPMKDLLDEAARIADIEVDYSESGPVGLYHRSDQYNFHQRQIPAVQLFSGLHDRYHTPSDTYASLNYTLLAHRIDYADTIIELLQKR